MSLLNRIKLVLLIFICSGNSLVFSSSKIKVCLTGRVVENLSLYGQSFLNAANLAKEQYDLDNKIEISKYYYDNKPLEGNPPDK